VKVGDMVKWYWHLGSSTWDATEFQGIIVASQIVKHEHEEVRVLSVLTSDDGSLCDVREDAPGLELIA